MYLICLCNSIINNIVLNQWFYFNLLLFTYHTLVRCEQNFYSNIFFHIFYVTSFFYLTKLLNINKFYFTCKNSTYCFCSVCGQFTLKTQQNPIKDLLKDSPFWLKTSLQLMPFAMLMFGSDSQNHENCSSFCMILYPKIAFLKRKLSRDKRSLPPVSLNNSERMANKSISGKLS